jgi:predicted ATPase
MGGDGVEADLQRALTLARQQHACLWELRAATSLANYWRANGKRQDAHNLLSSALRLADEHDLSDFAKARAVLKELKDTRGG